MAGVCDKSFLKLRVFHLRADCPVGKNRDKNRCENHPKADQKQGGVQQTVHCLYLKRTVQIYHNAAPVVPSFHLIVVSPASSKRTLFFQSNPPVGLRFLLRDGIHQIIFYRRDISFRIIQYSEISGLIFISDLLYRLSPKNFIKKTDHAVIIAIQRMASLFLRGFGAAGADGIFNCLCFCSLQLAVIFHNKIQNPVDTLSGDRKIGNVNQGSHQEHDQRQRDQRRLNEFIPKLSNSLFIHSDVLPVCLSAILLVLQSLALLPSTRLQRQPVASAPLSQNFHTGCDRCQLSAEIGNVKPDGI